MKAPGIALAMSCLAFSGSVWAGDPAAGEAKAEACLDCHEPSEDFAGMTAAEIEARINAARAGEFKHKDVIKEVPEEDIPDIAAWFDSESAE
jgi:cytochrome c553